jgi:hypothetical protein
MSLPPELLRHILHFLEDVECFDTAGCQPSSQRHVVEIGRGRRNVQTKSSLLLVSWQFYEMAIELAWSWICVYTRERLLWLDGVVSRRIVPKSLKRLKDHRAEGERRPEATERHAPHHYPTPWIRRLDVKMAIPTGRAYGHLSPTLAHLLRACPNLRVFVSDVSVGSVDCQRTASPVLDALKSLAHLTRVDWAGHEGPSLEDYVDLLPHLAKLEQWTTGRIASPRLDDDEIVELLGQRKLLGDDVEHTEENRTRAIVLPNLRSLHVSHRPLYSCLRLFAHMDLPSLTHISFRHLDFHAPRIDSLFTALGHQFTHLYTHDIRTSVEPFGYAHVLAMCPNLEHLTFSPRLRDDRHQQDWRHPRLRTLGLRSVLPITVPHEPQLANNIGLSVQAFLQRVLGARVARDLPSLAAICIEDAGDAALEYETKYGGAWDAVCRTVDIRLEDAEGRHIPSELPALPPRVVCHADPRPIPGDVVDQARKKKPSGTLEVIFGRIAGRIQQYSE